jgi:hypothetical protein
MIINKRRLIRALVLLEIVGTLSILRRDAIDRLSGKDTEAVRRSLTPTTKGFHCWMPGEGSLFRPRTDDLTGLFVSRITDKGENRLFSGSNRNKRAIESYNTGSALREDLMKHSLTKIARRDDGPSWSTLFAG